MKCPAWQWRQILLNRYDRASPMSGEAEVKYLDGDFRVVRPGAFVRCAVTGVPIPLEELKYWSVDLRSEEHTSELQSHVNLVCRLLLEKKKKIHLSLVNIFSSILFF